jgi:hypothetical protein
MTDPEQIKESFRKLIYSNKKVKSASSEHTLSLISSINTAMDKYYKKKKTDDSDDVIQKQKLVVKNLMTIDQKLFDTKETFIDKIVKKYEKQIAFFYNTFTSIHNFFSDVHKRISLSLRTLYTDISRTLQLRSQKYWLMLVQRSATIRNIAHYFYDMNSKLEEKYGKGYLYRFITLPFRAVYSAYNTIKKGVSWILDSTLIRGIIKGFKTVASIAGTVYEYTIKPILKFGYKFIRGVFDFFIFKPLQILTKFLHGLFTNPLFLLGLGLAFTFALPKLWPHIDKWLSEMMPVLWPKIKTYIKSMLGEYVTQHLTSLMNWIEDVGDDIFYGIMGSDIWNKTITPFVINVFNSINNFFISVKTYITDFWQTFTSYEFWQQQIGVMWDMIKSHLDILGTYVRDNYLEKDGWFNGSIADIYKLVNIVYSYFATPEDNDELNTIIDNAEQVLESQATNMLENNELMESIDEQTQSLQSMETNIQRSHNEIEDMSRRIETTSQQVDDKKKKSSDIQEEMRKDPDTSQDVSVISAISTSPNDVNNVSISIPNVREFSIPSTITPPTFSLVSPQTPNTVGFDVSQLQTVGMSPASIADSVSEDAPQYEKMLDAVNSYNTLNTIRNTSTSIDNRESLESNIVEHINSLNTQITNYSYNGQKYQPLTQDSIQKNSDGSYTITNNWANDSIFNTLISNRNNTTNLTLNQNKDGAVLSTPSIMLVAEEKTPEMVIPLNRSGVEFIANLTSKYNEHQENKQKDKPKMSEIQRIVRASPINNDEVMFDMSLISRGIIGA